MKPHVAALFARLREPRTRLLLFAVAVLQTVVTFAMRDPQDVRRTTIYWVVPLVVLCAIATAYRDEWLRQRTGWRDLEFLHAAPLTTRALMDWFGRGSVCALLAALVFAPIAWPVAGERFGNGAATGRRPFAQVGVLDLWYAGDGYRLPETDFAGTRSLHLPYATRPLDPDAAGDVRLQLEVGVERGGKIELHRSTLGLRDTLVVPDLGADPGRLVLRHAGPVAGLVRLEFDRMHLVGERVPRLEEWAVVTLRLTLFLAWTMLLFGAALALLDLPIAMLWTGCALLPTWIELPDALRLALGHSGLETYRSIVPDWNAGLALVPWSDGIVVPLSDVPWTALCVSSTLLLAIRVIGTRRHARRLEPREDLVP